MNQAEQDIRESFNAHRMLNLPLTRFYFIGPHEAILLRLEQENHLGVTSKTPYDSTQLEPYYRPQHYRPRRRKTKRKTQADFRREFMQTKLDDYLTRLMQTE